MPVVVEFADYQCPFCRQAHLRFVELLPALQVGVVYRHLPLTRIHPAAEDAARAAICAEDQGRFRAMHERLFASTDWQAGAEWTRLAREAGVPDTAAFSECLNSESTARRLAADVELAEELGVRSTPTFVSPQDVHSGVPTRDELAELISP